jgi:hypothetical protein
MTALTSRGTRVIGVVSALAPALCACGSFGIYSPTNNAVLDGATASVDIKGGPSMSGLKVSLDGTDVTSSLTATSASEYTSNAPGLPINGTSSAQHVLTAEADIYCWYCSHTTFHEADKVTFCTGGQTNIGTVSKIAFSKNDMKGWSNNSNNTVDVADNYSPSTSQTRWDLVPLALGGPGFIVSVKNRCVCMTSVDEKNDTPVALQVCDTHDGGQQWQSLPVTGAPGFFQMQNRSHGTNFVCLKEGGGNLVQRACDATDSRQLWSFLDLTSGLSGQDRF